MYENILVYFSYKMRASPWLICLKYLKYKWYLFWPERFEFESCSTLLEKTLAYLTILY